MRPLNFDADYKLSPLERMLLTAAGLYRDASTPHRQSAAAGGGGGGSVMSLVVQGGVPSSVRPLREFQLRRIP